MRSYPATAGATLRFLFGTPSQDRRRQHILSPPRTPKARTAAYTHSHPDTGGSGIHPGCAGSSALSPQQRDPSPFIAPFPPEIPPSSWP